MAYACIFHAFSIMFPAFRRRFTAAEAYQTLPEPANGPYGHAQKPGEWYLNDGGRFIDSYDYPEPYAEQAALQRATGGDVLHLLKGAAKKQANWCGSSDIRL